MGPKRKGMMFRHYFREDTFVVDGAGKTLSVRRKIMACPVDLSGLPSTSPRLGPYLRPCDYSSRISDFKDAPSLSTGPGQLPPADGQNEGGGHGVGPVQPGLEHPNFQILRALSEVVIPDEMLQKPADKAP